MEKEQYKYTIHHSKKIPTEQYGNEDVGFVVKGDDMDQVVADLQALQELYKPTVEVRTAKVIADTEEPEEVPQKVPAYVQKAKQWTKKKTIDAKCPVCNDGDVTIIKEGRNRKGPWYMFGCSLYPKCQGAGPSWQEPGSELLPF